MNNFLPEIYKELLNSILNYTNLIKQNDNISDIINLGLKVFTSNKNIEYCFLYLQNKDTFEFEFRAVQPQKDLSKQFINTDIIFESVVESGKIGEALENLAFTNFSKIKIGRKFRNGIIIPLIFSNSILGIVIVIFKEKVKDFEESKNEYDDLLNIFSTIYSSAINDIILQKNLQETITLLNQKVAARTLNLAQSKLELQMILDSVHAAILMIDFQTNKIVNVNPQALKIIGEKQEDIINKDASSYFGNDYDKNTDFLKFSRNFESSIKVTGGMLIPILRTSSVITLGENKYRIESFFDNSERKKAEILLKQANELLELKVMERTEDLQILVHKLQEEISAKELAETELRAALDKELELNELKSKFVAMVSHEFRTPLTIISSAAQLLHEYYDKMPEKERIESLIRIIDTVENMDKTLDSVLFIDNSKSNNSGFKPEQIELFKFCENIVENVQISLKNRRNIIIENRIENRYPILDPILLNHILYNLLLNAVKYSGDDKPVEFCLYCNIEKSVFVVKDYGIGIPDEEQKKIFDIFHRAKNVGKIAGTGLGMSIVLRSLELHKGKIEVASKVNQGTTFTVTIPNIKI